MKSEGIQCDEENETLLPTSHNVDARVQSRQRLHICARWFLVICSLIAAVTGGFVLGRWQQNLDTNYGLSPPPGDIVKQFHHNLTFTQKPSPESEAAWSSIIPVGRGFITHPQLAPFISNIALYHQLHCLHAVVVAYYDALASPPMEMADVPDFDSPTGTRTAPFHVRHCFDYLRQTIMCHADTNLEVLDPVNHTTNGWNQDKVCRNYEMVNAFAERWANSTDTGIVT